MWQFAQAPVRAMDEVDKNMDATFVRESLRLLLEIWAEQRQRQFLILTPLDYSTPLAELGVTPAEAEARGLRFLKLQAPRADAGGSASQQ